MPIAFKIVQENEKLNLDDVIKLSGLDYTPFDQTKNSCLLYNRNAIARGIYVKVDTEMIYFDIGLPTSIKEIDILLDLLKNICHKLNKQSFIYEKDEIFEEEKIDNCNQVRRYAIDCSLKKLKECDVSQYIIPPDSVKLYCVKFPVDVGQRELEFVDGDLNKLGKLLHNLQSQDVYYPERRFYKIKKLANRIVGSYICRPGKVNMLPRESMSLSLNEKEKVTDWWVIWGNEFFDLDEFMSEVDSQYFFQNWVTVYLDDDELEKVTEKCGMIRQYQKLRKSGLKDIDSLIS